MNEHHPTLPEECGWARRQMARGVEDPLSEAEAARMRRHVEACEACGAVASWVPQIDTLAEAVPFAPDPGPAYFAQVRQNVLSDIGGGGTSRRRRLAFPVPVLRWAGGLVAVAVVGLISWQFMGPSSNPVELANRSQPSTVQSAGKAQSPARSVSRTKDSPVALNDAVEETDEFAGQTPPGTPLSFDREPTAGEDSDQPGGAGLAMVVEGPEGEGARDVILGEEQVLPEGALAPGAKRSLGSLGYTADSTPGRGHATEATQAVDTTGAVRIDEEPGKTQGQQIRSALDLAREPGGDAGVFEDAIVRLMAALEELDPPVLEPQFPGDANARSPVLSKAEEGRLREALESRAERMRTLAQSSRVVGQPEEADEKDADELESLLARVQEFLQVQLSSIRDGELRARAQAWLQRREAEDLPEQDQR